MSAAPKPAREPIQTGRQSKLTMKTRFHFLIEDDNYDWIYQQMRARGLSAAAVLNDLIRKVRST